MIKVLDVGCWNGKRVARLKGVCDIYGIDTNTQRFNEAPLHIQNRLLYGDIEKEIKFKDFDYVFCTEVIEHVKDDKKLLDNCNKCLKIGGTLLLSTPKKVKLLDVWDPAWIRWKLGGNKHYHYSKLELFNKLHEAGFEIDKYYVRGSMKWLAYRWINVFLKYILRVKEDKLLSTQLNKGFFEWSIYAKKIKEI